MDSRYEAHYERFEPLQCRQKHGIRSCLVRAFVAFVDAAKTDVAGFAAFVVKNMVMALAAVVVTFRFHPPRFQQQTWQN